MSETDNIIRSNGPVLKFKNPKSPVDKVDSKPEIKEEKKVEEPTIQVSDDLEKMVLRCLEKLQVTMLQGEPGIRGPQGPSGPPGRDGAPGKKGDTGAPGKNGPPGKDGVDGINGLNGINGENGMNGLDGMTGPEGKPGPPGVNGKKGDPGTCHHSSSSSSTLKTKSTIYVDQKYGDDETAVAENAGKPFKSISKAIKHAKNDECIILAPGNYGTLQLKPGVWIEGSHGLVLFDQIVTSENYKWKKNEASYISKISIRSNDKPALITDRGTVILNYCNLSTIYSRHSNNDAILCDIKDSKVHVNGSNLTLESYGSNDLCTSIYAKGNETEVLMDNNAFEIKREGSDSLVYTLYNAVKMGNIRISRSDVVIDADDTNKVQMEYVSEDAGINSEIKGTTFGERSTATSYKSGKSEIIHKPVTTTHNSVNTIITNSNTRIIKTDVTLLPTDNFIIISSEQKCSITLPLLNAPKLKELSGNVQSIVYIIKSTKEFVTHQIITGDNNRINEFDKSISIDNNKTIYIRSVGSDWITY